MLNLGWGKLFIIINRLFKMILLRWFVKISKGAIMGQRYFDLAEIEGFNREMSTEEIAQFLRGKFWE